MSPKTIGIITTTYNRGYCIHQVYESLKSQTCKNFMWLVVDDGSTDNTREIIHRFKEENEVDIEYIYQPNKGMTGARNTAYRVIRTEINTIIDSDDWLAPDAIRLILEYWDKNKADQIAGIVALDITPDGNIVGSPLPVAVRTSTVMDLFYKYKLRGDKKLIYRSDLTRLYPYPEFEGENFFPPSYKFFMLDTDYEMLLMNCPVCVVNYTPDSMTYDKVGQYKSCVKGFAFYRNECMRLSSDPKFLLKQAIHYIASSLLCGNKRFIKESSKKRYTIFCLPVGIAFYFFLKHTKRKMLRFS